jgi:CDP-diacylglycerol--serine O-phosphatidyltransferase
MRSPRGQDGRAAPGDRPVSPASGGEHRYPIHCTAAAGSAIGEVAITPLLGFGAPRQRTQCVILQSIRVRAGTCSVHAVFQPAGGRAPGDRRQDQAGLPGDDRRRRQDGQRFLHPQPTKPFTTIGALPYLYEANLRRFCKRTRDAVDQGLLDLHSGGTTTQLSSEGAAGRRRLRAAHRQQPQSARLAPGPRERPADPRSAGLSARASTRPNSSASCAIAAVSITIRRSTRSASYPEPVQRILKRLAHTRADRLLNQVL